VPGFEGFLAEVIRSLLSRKQWGGSSPTGPVFFFLRLRNRKQPSHRIVSLDFDFFVENQGFKFIELA
jgi:hypothetical protein